MPECPVLNVNVYVQLVEIDRRRQALREGARSLKKQAAAAACDVPVWVELPGGVPIQLPYNQAENWLSEGAVFLHCNVLPLDEILYAVTESGVSEMAHDLWAL